jgi:hypothetical protein
LFGAGTEAGTNLARRDEGILEAEVGVDGGLAGDEGVESGGEAVEVECWTEALPWSELFGSGIAGTAIGRDELGLEAPIDEEDRLAGLFAPRVDHEVVGFDVAVEQTLGVDGFKAGGDRSHDLKRLGFGNGLLTQDLGEGASGDGVLDDYRVVVLLEIVEDAGAVGLGSGAEALVDLAHPGGLELDTKFVGEGGLEDDDLTALGIDSAKGGAPVTSV